MAYCLMCAKEDAALDGRSPYAYLHPDVYRHGWTLMTSEQYGKANRSYVLCTRCFFSALT